MILQTRNIILERAKAQPLSFSDLSLAQGDAVLVAGPSGSGKTTFLSIIAGLQAPTRGQILLNGADLYDMPSSQRDRERGQNFGFIFQTLHLLPGLGVRDNILLAAKMAEKPAEPGRVENLLQSLGLKGKEHRKPHELSQGERQRVAIARAVLNRPKILIADEPTSALDDQNAQITISLIREQAKETGAALLLATHDSRIAQGFTKTLHLNTILMEAA